MRCITLEIEKKTHKINPEYMLALYRAGLTWDEISDITGYSAKYVANMAYKYNSQHNNSHGVN